MLDLRHPYLSRQLIAYIGNKRRLLPFLHRAIVAACGNDCSGLTFLDLFAGSGAVSRLAKLMGFRVLCNDWEEFALHINTAHVAVDAAEADRLFAAEGGLDAALAGLNGLSGPPPEGEYIARYYAPRQGDVEAADYRTERLFYTRANALAIDRIRSEIDRLEPPGDASPEAGRRRALLIAPLLYEAATHTNTSGVFKAFHKGFGGHGRDALRRILGPIELEAPLLIDASWPAEVFAEDANALVRFPAIADRIVDVAYVDPPYATHQYGSNYHLLTTIARWDKPPAPLDLDERGVLKDKAGIRRDWVRTRSRYCSRATAAAALADLIGALHARLILVSYSSEGIIPFDTLLDICSGRGEVTVLADEYTKYPGGKQSRERLIHNVETVLVVDTTRQASPSGRLAAELTLERRRTMLLLGRRFVRHRLAQVGELVRTAGGEELRIPLGGDIVSMPIHPDSALHPPPGLGALGIEELSSLRHTLAPCACCDAEEELAELLRIARDGRAPEVSLLKLLARTLKRLAHRKNRERYAHWLGALRSLVRDEPGAFAGPRRARTLQRTVAQSMKRRTVG